jgi:hypothetical protein
MLFHEFMIDDLCSPGKLSEKERIWKCISILLRNDDFSLSKVSEMLGLEEEVISKNIAHFVQERRLLKIPKGFKENLTRSQFKESAIDIAQKRWRCSTT